jgi:hypothetical protein
MLAKQPEDRPASMAEVETMLTALMSEVDPITTLPFSRDKPRVDPDLEITSTKTLADPRRQPSLLSDTRTMKLIAAALVAASLASLVTYMALRKTTPVSEPSPDAMLVTPEPVDAAIARIDARVVVDALDTTDRRALEIECLQAQSAKRWPALQECGRALERLEPARGKLFVLRATKEAEYEALVRTLDAALKDGNIEAARAAFAKIPADSVYHPEAEKHLKAAACDAAKETQRGDEAATLGNHAAALAAFERSYACKDDLNIAKRAYVAACNAKNNAAAKTWFERLGKPDPLLQVCLRQGFDPR